MLNIGNTYECPLVFTLAQERQFMDLTGDVNPIHWDNEAAIKEGFPAPIVHGMLAASIIGKVIGMDFPRTRTINIERSFKFIRPMFIDEKYLLKIKIVDVNPISHLAEMKFYIKDTNSKLCLTGLTTIKNSRLFAEESSI